MTDTHVALKDGNSVSSAIFESSTNPGVILRGKIDEITGRILVDATGGGTTNFADNETPSGTINGVNAVFTLAHTPSPAGSLQLFLNGALQQAGGGDYTLATATITFVSAPLTGSILIAWYRY